MRPEVAIIATHVAPAKGYGGVVEFTANLARAWVDQGRSFMICASDASRHGRVTEAEATAVLGVKVRLYRTFWFKRWGFGLGALWQIPGAIWRAETVLICGVATWPVTIGALAAWLLGRPYVVSPRGGLMAAHLAAIRRSKPHKWLYHRLLTFPLVRRARIVYVTSDVERDGVLALLPRSHTVLIPNGVDLDRWHFAPPPELGRGRILCFVGRIAHEKGINSFVRTWLQVRGPDDRLIIAGDADGSYAEELRALAAQAGDAIELLGYLDQAGVHAALARSHLLILPSGLEGGERENFGNVVAEALAVGRPVLVSRGLAWDHVEELRIGFLIDRDAPSVVRALDRIGSLDANDFAAQCTAARRFAEANLDVRLESQRLWNLLSQLAAERSITTEP